jgi:hypothetical protein
MVTVFNNYIKPEAKMFKMVEALVSAMEPNGLKNKNPGDTGIINNVI